MGIKLGHNQVGSDDSTRARSEQLEILLIEDNPGDAALVNHYAKDMREDDGVVCKIVHVNLICHAMDQIRRRQPDAILLDLGLPDASDLDGLREIAAVAPSVPVIVLTGDCNPDLPLQALNAGAQDYLPKDGLNKDVLLRAVCYAIERKKLEDTLRRQVRLDKLTGLMSRAHFDEKFSEVLSHANRLADICAVCLIDLDGFKAVNDNMGHQIGDQLLAQAGSRLLECTRKTDLVARLGGDEFVVVATHLKDDEAAKTVARTITSALSRRYPIDGLRSEVSASVGVSLYPLNDTSAQILLKQADAAMYHAKRAGPGGYAFYGEWMEGDGAETSPLLSDPVS